LALSVTAIPAVKAAKNAAPVEASRMSVVSVVTIALGKISAVPKVHRLVKENIASTLELFAAQDPQLEAASRDQSAANPVVAMEVDPAAGMVVAIPANPVSRTNAMDPRWYLDQ